MELLTRLEPSDADAFEGGDVLARFERDNAGRVTTMRIGIPRVRDLAFGRIAP